MIRVTSTPVVRDLVLVGGGHSHIAVVKAFRMRPLAGVRVTLVSRGWDSPYSGMLPGVVAGVYSRDEAHIDLLRLCRHCGVRFIRAEVTGLDADHRTISLAGRPAMSYDVLSLNTGSTPASVHVSAQAAPAVISTKPIDGFLCKWERLRRRLLDEEERLDIVFVGGGVAGVELALAVEARLRADGVPPDRCRVSLLNAGERILETHSRAVAQRLMHRLSERGIRVQTSVRAGDVGAAAGADSPDALEISTSDGARIRADAVIWATQAAPAPWLAAASLTTDSDGFVTIDEYLRSVSHPDVFAVGDVASSATHPRPKAGVFAVRQGRPLAENLRRHLLGRPLRRYVPQRRFLSLIGTADGAAVASRGSWSAQGRWVWAWKDRIDRRFMRRYRIPDLDSDAALPDSGMVRPEPGVLALHPVPELTGPHRDGMRCAGCGSKAGPDVLSGALRRLRIEDPAHVLQGIHARDDAAVVQVRAGRDLVLSVDAFRPIVEDPFLFGAITANHCLNDLYAMHAQPLGALAQVTLPVWAPEKLSEELYQMLAGALSVLEPAGAPLLGGHTGEGAELALGFTVTGTVEHGRAFAKTGHSAGDALILTKPLGTGCLFAAEMRAQADAAWIAAAVDAMSHSNERAADCLAAHDAHAVTDVTGFGLAGHIRETLGDDPLCAELHFDSIPLLPGVPQLLARGWVSSLHAANRRWTAGDFDTASRLSAEARKSVHGVLFDPQTAGPLVASVPSARASACVSALRAAGYEHATVIGRITARPPDSAVRIRLADG